MPQRTVHAVVILRVFGADFCQLIECSMTVEGAYNIDGKMAELWLVLLILPKLGHMKHILTVRSCATAIHVLCQLSVV